MRDHNYQSRAKNYHTRFILTVENEKSLYEKKNHHSRISISFFSEPLRLSSQRRVFWRDYLSSLKWRSNFVAEDFTDLIDSLRSFVERTASVYRASDHVGLQICARKFEEHTRMLIAISQSQNSSLQDLFKVLEVSLDMLLRKTSDILNASRILPKENPPLAFLASTGGRRAYIITKEMIEQLRETRMKWRNVGTCLGISEQTLNRYGIAFGAENNFTDITILPQIGRHMELSMMVH